MVRFLIFFVLLVMLARFSTASTVRLTESGSTLMYPLATTWARAWPEGSRVPLDTNPTGSGQGVSDVISGTAQLGMTDVYALDDQAAAALTEIPLAIGGVQLSYNVPEAGDAHVRFTGDLLAAIYSGSIRYWDDPALRAINPQLPHPLPHRAIVTYHRSDPSGTTFVFTQFLSASSGAWKTGPGYGDRVRWPAGPWSHDVSGNAGVLLACEVLPYSLGYVGVSYRSRVRKRFSRR